MHIAAYFFKENFTACFEVSRVGSSSDCQLSIWEGRRPRDFHLSVGLSGS